MSKTGANLVDRACAARPAALSDFSVSKDGAGSSRRRDDGNDSVPTYNQILDLEFIQIQGV
jgi:hypothetical protein